MSITELMAVFMRIAGWIREVVFNGVKWKHALLKDK